MFRWMVIGIIVALSSVSVAQAQNRGQVLWTVSGAGAGFGVGLWAGLSAFDDAVNSDRKVWTSAIVGAGIGAVAGYLIGRSRSNHSQPSTTTTVMKTSRQMAEERQSLEYLAKSFRFDGGRDSSPSLLSLHRGCQRWSCRSGGSRDSCIGAAHFDPVISTIEVAAQE